MWATKFHTQWRTRAEFVDFSTGCDSSASANSISVADPCLSIQWLKVQGIATNTINGISPTGESTITW
jgi:hypothetical protein